MISLFVSSFLLASAVFLYVLRGILKDSMTLKRKDLLFLAFLSIGCVLVSFCIYGTLGAPDSSSSYAYGKNKTDRSIHLRVLVAMLEDKCLEADCVTPKNSSDYILLAQSYQRLGLFKKSADTYKKILEYMPDQGDIQKAYKDVMSK